jgi:hypothetical protein
MEKYDRNEPKSFVTKYFFAIKPFKIILKNYVVKNVFIFG